MSATVQNAPVNGHPVANGSQALERLFNPLPDFNDYDLSPQVLQALQLALSHLSSTTRDPLNPDGFFTQIRDSFLQRRGRQQLIRLKSDLPAACDSLVKQLENPNWRVRDAAYAALNACYPYTRTGSKNLRCAAHVARFISRQIESKAYPYCKYASVVACRICGLQYGAIQANQVVAVLDDKETRPAWYRGDELNVNWLKTKREFDFDRVEIPSSSDHDILQFAIFCNNHPDFFEAGTLAKLPCFVSPSITIQLNSRRILATTFALADGKHEIT